MATTSAPTAGRAPSAFSTQRWCKNLAYIQLRWGLVRLNHDRCFAEVGEGHPAPAAWGAEGGEPCFLGTMLFLLEGQNVVWKANGACGKPRLLCWGNLGLSLPCW